MVSLGDRLQLLVRMDKNKVLCLRDWAKDNRKNLNEWLSNTIDDGMRKEGIL